MQGWYRVLFIFFALFFCTSFIVPQMAYAQIVPCGNSQGVDSNCAGFSSPGACTSAPNCYWDPEAYTCNGYAGTNPTQECSVCHLQVLAMNILNFIVSTSVLIAALMFLHAGTLYVLSSTNTGNIARAHRIFTVTLTGLIIILSAWLIVNIIMSTFYNTAQFGRWDTVLCTPTGTTGGPTPPPQQPPTTPPTTGEGTLSEEEARAALEGRVGIWESRPGATTFDGIQQTTIDGVLWMADDSGLNRSQMIITGAVDGDEYHAEGTYSHGNGYKIDLEDTPEMNNYIESTFTQDGYRDGNPRYVTTINGRPVEAVHELDGRRPDVAGQREVHWDITFR